MTSLDLRAPVELDAGLEHAATPAEQPDAYWVADWALDAEGELELELELWMLQGESLGWEPLDEGVYVHAPRAPVPYEVCVVGLPSPGLQEQWAILLV